MRDLEADMNLCVAANSGPGGTLASLAQHERTLARFSSAAREGWPETIRELQAARIELAALRKKLEYERSRRDLDED